MADDKVEHGEDFPVHAMTSWPNHLLSLDEWDALPEDNSRRYELAEGVLQVSPRPRPSHQWAISRLWSQVDDQLPPELVALPEVEVTLFGAHPATVRVPDLVVVPATTAKQNLTRFTAADVILAIEVISPGSARTDRTLKSVEYAAAGIEHYWIVDPDQPVITAYRQVGGAYKEVGKATTRLVADDPAPITIAVHNLLP